MKQQVFHQLSVEQLPFSACGIVFISGIYSIVASIFNIIIGERLVA